MTSKEDEKFVQHMNLFGLIVIFIGLASPVAAVFVFPNRNEVITMVVILFALAMIIMGCAAMIIVWVYFSLLAGN